MAQIEALGRPINILSKYPELLEVFINVLTAIPYTLEHNLTLISTVGDSIYGKIKTAEIVRLNYYAAYSGSLAIERAESPPHNDCITQNGGVGWHHNRKRKMLSVRISAAVRMEKSREARYNNKTRGYREAEGGGIRIKFTAAPRQIRGARAASDGQSVTAQNRHREEGGSGAGNKVEALAARRCEREAAAAMVAAAARQRPIVSVEEGNEQEAGKAVQEAGKVVQEAGKVGRRHEGWRWRHAEMNSSGWARCLIDAKHPIVNAPQATGRRQAGGEQEAAPPETARYQTQSTPMAMH
ncbi:hypothetical protein B0H14DRAFT_2627186 [Mycena olivaceomarginata]|nr:hypothetical protein B0H14DRAFT_2627186 [Mycena olivaceomarginata]